MMNQLKLKSSYSKALTYQPTSQPSGGEGHPNKRRYLQLASPDDSPNGAPVIITLATSEQEEELTSQGNATSFKSWGLKARSAFASSLESNMGPFVQDLTKWTTNGELHIYPTTQSQKAKLLEMVNHDGHSISCRVPKSESTLRGIIRVPASYEEEALKEELVEMNVVDVKSFSKGSSTATQIVCLTFNSDIIPETICIAREIFQVSKFIPRPKQCFNCWGFRHVKAECKNKMKCRRCSQPHDCLLTKCKADICCPNCSSTEHEGNSGLCLKIQEHQKPLRYAYENNIPVKVAGKLLAGSKQQQQQQQPTAALTGPIDAATEQRIATLEHQLVEMKKLIDPVPKAMKNLHQRMKEVEAETSGLKGTMTNLEITVQARFDSMDHNLNSFFTNLTARLDSGQGLPTGRGDKSTQPSSAPPANPVGAKTNLLRPPLLQPPPGKPPGSK